jgi:predicted Zn-dependent peptidase
MNFKTHVLPNGIKLIHIESDSSVAHCGFFIHTGSRDEEANEHGIAHFIEHLLFKGTYKRKSFHVLSRLEDVGGELNAYTTKEETCIHASFLKDHFPRAFELISDIVFNSSFPEKALVSERDVILDEINSYKDSPSEFIFDDFEERFYAKHPLGQNILGTAKNLKKITRQDILQFIEKNYCTDQMVLSSVGDIPFQRLKSLFEKYFGGVPMRTSQQKRYPFNTYVPFSTTLRKNTFQVHVVLGNTGYDLKDSRRLGLHLLSNIIAGPGMISRLNLALRERRGYSYNVESSFTPYSDTGIFNVYFSSDKDNVDKCLEIIYKEFAALREKKLGALQLKKAKQQIVGQLAMSYESNENQMLSAGKSFLVYDKVDTMEEVFARIEAVSAADLLVIANEVLDMNKMSKLIYR